MHATIRRALCAVGITAGIMLLGFGLAEAASADGNGPTTNGQDAILSGNQTGVGAQAPVNASGNQVTVIGHDNSTTSSGSSATASAPSGSPTTSGKDGAGSGNQTGVGVQAPVNASGNQVTVIGEDNSTTSSGAASSGGGATSASSPTTPAVLKWDNGEGLTFRRTIAVDDHYLFTIKDDVSNVGNAPVTLYPFALISRHGTPQVSGYYILHEGLIGYLDGLQEYAYKKIDEAKSVNFKATNGWLGMTDKYWASALLPDTSAQLQARLARDSRSAA